MKKIWHGLKTTVLNNNDYKLNISNRKKERVGLALVTKQAINFKVLASRTLTSFQYALWRITIRRTDITITAIYHPP